MAKVKTAKQKITEFLKAKGLDASEIKDAFDELDSADIDLDTLADTQLKNTQWATWYQTAGPEINNLVTERDALKEKMEQLKAAGIQVGDVKLPETPKQPAQGNFVSQESLDKFQRDLAKANSDVMKSLTRVGLKHYKDFNTEPDFDAVEKLINEGKAMDVEDAYNKWSAPMYAERAKKQTEEEIDRKVKEGVQAVLSKQGIRNTRKKVDADIDTERISDILATKDKKGPSESELREAFLSDINSEVAH